MSNFWKIFISIVATAGIIGGGTFYIMQRQLDSVRSDNQAKMDDLNKQIATLKSSSTTTTTPATTDETASWKTYTNTTYGYSFKYPESWVVGDSPTAMTPDPTSANVALDGSGYASDRFAVQVTQPTNCSTLQTCAEKNRVTFGTGEETTGLSSATVNGIAALSETITRPTQGEWKYYVNYLYRNGKLYVTHTIAKASDDSATKPTFDKILSTFQFTK